MTRSFDVFFDLRLNKRLSTQSCGWWFETLSCPWWRHCNGVSNGEIISISYHHHSRVDTYPLSCHKASSHLVAYPCLNPIFQSISSVKNDFPIDHIMSYRSGSTYPTSWTTAFPHITHSTEYCPQFLVSNFRCGVWACRVISQVIIWLSRAYAFREEWNLNNRYILWDDLIHKSHNATVPYSTMHHFVTEISTCVHISVTKRCIVGHLSNALWDVWVGSILHALCMMTSHKDQSVSNHQKLDCLSNIFDKPVRKQQSYASLSFR